MARQAVVGDRLPRRGVCDELVKGRTDARIAVDRAETDPDSRGVRGAAAEHRGPAVAAEPLLRPAFGLPRLEPVLALHHAERAGRDRSARGRSGAGAALTTRAMAV